MIILKQLIALKFFFHFYPESKLSEWKMTITKSQSFLKNPVSEIQIQSRTNTDLKG